MPPGQWNSKRSEKAGGYEQQRGGAAGGINVGLRPPPNPDDLAWPRFSVSRRIATDSAWLDAGSDRRRYRLAAPPARRIDTGTRPIAFRRIVHTDPCFEPG